MSVQNYHKPALFHANVFYRHAKALFEELHNGHLRQDKEQSTAFGLFYCTNVQQTKMIFNSDMPLFISIIRLFDYETIGKARKW